MSPKWQFRGVALAIVVVIGVLAYVLPTLTTTASKASDNSAVVTKLCDRAVNTFPQVNLLRIAFKNFVNSDADFREQEAALTLQLFQELGMKGQSSPIGVTIHALASLNATYEDIWRKQAAAIKTLPPPRCET